MTPPECEHKEENEEGNVSKALIALIGGSGLLGVLAAGMMAVANDARIAISVAEQHGQEILILRGEINSLRQEMAERTKDRFTSKDHEQYDRYIQERFAHLEQMCEEARNAPCRGPRQ